MPADDLAPLRLREPEDFDDFADFLLALLLAEDLVPPLREPPADFFAEGLERDRLLPPEVFLLLDDFRPRDADDFLAFAGPRRALLFLLDDFLDLIPAARLAAPLARVAAALTVATFFGLLAAVPAIAPSTPPITVPTGPATLPTIAPVAAPAVVFEIGGTSIVSEDEGWFSDDC